jgi:hypothetical protein
VSDKDILIEMLNRAGVKYEETCGGRPYGEDRNDETLVSVSIDGGYSGFYTVLTFNQDGSLKSIGAFE